MTEFWLLMVGSGILAGAVGLLVTTGQRRLEVWDYNRHRED